VKGEMVGTVRVFPSHEGHGHWIGGRLAVRRAHRSTGAGEWLVREAVSYVKRHGCGKFTAHIQENNVPFFLKLGWRTVGPPGTYHGRLHQWMEADLKLVEEFNSTPQPVELPAQCAGFLRV
jgi:putative N-acetyltransferase (TIGR04045 family)